MPNELDDSNQAYEAQQMVEAIAEGDEKAPSVNVEDDYEASKAYSTSEVDQTGEGAAAAAAATAPKFKVSTPEETNTTAQSTGDPQDYLEMAKEVNPRIAE
jgi:2-keto-4-pentenoate hydratase